MGTNTLVSACSLASLVLVQPYLFQIHALHRSIHALDHIRHAARHRPHRDGRLHARADGIQPRAQSQQVDLLILLADRILRVDLGDVGVALLDCLGVMERGANQYCWT